MKIEKPIVYCSIIGTTEHLVDQVNAFRIAHDLIRSGGLMLHTLPFTGNIDHGFFNYNPNFFFALARFNSYEILGLWIQPGGMASLIPWHKNIVDHLELSGKRSTSIICLFRKEYGQKFCIPFQKGYEGVQDKSNLTRYNYVIDGGLMSGVDAHRISNRNQPIELTSFSILVDELKRRIMRRLRLNRW